MISDAHEGLKTAIGAVIGLYIARQLTQAMRGQVWVGDAGPGAEFYVLLPTD